MSQSQLQSQGGESKRKASKRKDRAIVQEYEQLQGAIDVDVSDMVKPTEDGRRVFNDKFDKALAIQENANTQEARGAASAVRGADVVVRFAQIGLKRSKNIAQGSSGFSIKDFIKHLQNTFPGSAADDNADAPRLDWTKNAEVCASLAAACATHMQCQRANFHPFARHQNVRTRLC